MSRGLFITFEGPEGCGKSTQSSRLTEDLASDGYDVIHTHEPGGTDLGNKIRELLLQRDDIRLDRTAELLLFEADRAQHIEELIKPAVEAGKIVLCDRFNTATFAYQGYGLGMDMELIESVDKAACGGLAPDLTILLDIDIETGLKRAGKTSSADRMEKRSKDFHGKVRQGYLSLAKKSGGRIKVVNVTEGLEETYEQVKELVFDFITTNYQLPTTN